MLVLTISINIIKINPKIHPVYARFPMLGKNFVTLLVVFLSLMLNGWVLGESLDENRSVYNVDFGTETFNENSASSGSLTRESLWLLAEKYYLGRGVEVNEGLAKKYIEEASARSPSLITNSLLTLINKNTDFTRKAIHRDGLYQNLEITSHRCQQMPVSFELGCRCHRFEARPTELFFYFSDLMGP